MKNILILITLSILSAFNLNADTNKMICASKAQDKITVDGVLDEPSWQNTEVCVDLMSVSSKKPPKRKSKIRALFDENNLYIGLEFSWEDITILKKGVNNIIKKYGSPKREVCSIRKYSNTYGVEIFIDPAASGINYYQILFNAAGQLTGNYKCLWDNFNIKPYFKSKINQYSWTAEFAYPVKGLKTGDVWGFNICRNDETYYAIWKDVGSNYHNPKLFGKLLIGDYDNWWNAIWGKKTQNKLKNIKEKINDYSKIDPAVKPLYDRVRKMAETLTLFAKNNSPDKKENFKILYKKYMEFYSKYARLISVCDTLDKMEYK